jgi:GcrA cell cycle regulator
LEKFMAFEASYRSNPGWTEERVALAVRLWLEGKSAREVGKALGVTRNAAIGLLHRKGYKRGAQPPPRPKRNRPAPLTSWKKATKEERTPPRPRREPPPAPDMRLLTLDQLELDSCRFIIGDARDPAHRYCGADGAPFCPYHRALCYQPAEVKAEDLTGRTFTGMRW